MILFLHGPDTFRSRRKLKEIKERFLRDVDRSGFNLTVLEGKKLSAADFEQAALTAPFLAPKRMVVIEDLLSAGSPVLKKRILELLTERSFTDTILVFWEGEGAKKKSRGKSVADPLAERLAAEKFAQAFKLLTPAEVRQWAAAEIKTRGGQIAPEALALLTDYVGNDLWRMDREIGKLLAFCNGQSISRSVVEQLVLTSLDEDIFRLTDAIGERNQAAALQLIDQQLRTGTSPLELLDRITWQFRNLLRVKSFVEANGPGYPVERISYQIGLHPFVTRKTLAQSNRHSLPQLRQIYQRLVSIDYQLKTTQTDPAVLFDLLVMKS